MVGQGILKTRAHFYKFESISVQFNYLDYPSDQNFHYNLFLSIPVIWFHFSHSNSGLGGKFNLDVVCMFPDQHFVFLDSLAKNLMTTMKIMLLTKHGS